MLHQDCKHDQMVLGCDVGIFDKSAAIVSWCAACLGDDSIIIKIKQTQNKLLELCFRFLVFVVVFKDVSMCTGLIGGMCVISFCTI